MLRGKFLDVAIGDFKGFIIHVLCYQVEIFHFLLGGVREVGSFIEMVSCIGPTIRNLLGSLLDAFRFFDRFNY